jgi:hypothetical protein
MVAVCQGRPASLSPPPVLGRSCWAQPICRSAAPSLNSSPEDFAGERSDAALQAKTPERKLQAKTTDTVERSRAVRRTATLSLC